MLKLSAYLDKAKLAPTLQFVDWTGPAMPVLRNIEGNDQYGDCVEAEDAHFVAVMTGNAGPLYSYTPAQTLADYSALTGFDPSNPSTDQGTDPIADMQARLSTPYADGSTLDGFALVDATDEQEWKWALQYLGNLKIWLALPDSYVNPFPSDGTLWDTGTPDPSNGHCVGCYGFTPEGLPIATWGVFPIMTVGAFAVLCSPQNGGGCAVRLSRDWMQKQGGTPSGFAYSDLLSDIQALGGMLADIVPPGP